MIGSSLLTITSVLLLLLSNLNEIEGSSKRMVGYWNLANGYQNQTGCPQVLTPDRIPAELYTHMIYSFAFIGPDQSVIEPDNLTIPIIAEFQSMKERNSNLKMMVSLGGWSMDMSLYSTAVATDETRTRLIKNIMAYLRKWNWDGMDFDWEYPSDPTRGGTPNDPQNYVLFMQQMRQAVEAEVVPEGKSKLQLSLALPGGPYHGQYYLMSSIIQEVDFANIMAYNLHGPWEPVVYCSANFYDGTAASSPYHGYSINDAVSYFLNQDGQTLPAEKFNLGVTFAGVAFTLSDPNTYTPGSGAVGEGHGGNCTRESGYMAYFEVDTLLKSGTVMQPKFDDVGYCKYFVYETNQWIGYDDADTLTQKVGLVEKMGLGGISIWAMYAESAEGSVLQHAIADALNEGSASSPSSSSSSSASSNSIFAPMMMLSLLLISLF